MTSTNSETMDQAKTDHLVTVEWHDHSFSPTETLTCKADPSAICHAVWDCDCESWDEQGIEDGTPWHGYSSDDGDVRHFGQLDPTECGLVNWFENSEEVMRGSVTFPVVPTFHGDYYTFEPVADRPSVNLHTDTLEAILGSDLVRPHVPADGKPHAIDIAWIKGEANPRVVVDGVEVNRASEPGTSQGSGARECRCRGQALPHQLHGEGLRSRLAEAEAEVALWTEKAQEAGAAYANANTKHHAEWERANRLEGMAERLAERAVELEDRAWKAEAKVARVEAALAVIDEVAYAEIALEKMLTIMPTGPSRAAVPEHWRDEVQERAAPFRQHIEAALRDPEPKASDATV